MSVIDDRDDEDEIRAHAALPNADVDIVCRRAADAAFIGISIQPVPFSFDRVLAMNPFQFWGQLAAAAWLPWLQGMRTITSQYASAHASEPEAKE
jgi:hypothetical protein